MSVDPSPAFSSEQFTKASALLGESVCKSLGLFVIPDNRFGFEPEVTARIARKGFRVYEMGISYSGRTYKEGKKIGWKDGFKAIWCILKYGITTP